MGEYFISSAVVGSRMFIARTMLGWFPPMVLMPDCENPIAESSRSSSAPAWPLMVALVVEKESRTDKISCAASEYA